jgi:hypothetical protein
MASYIARRKFCWAARRFVAVARAQRQRCRSSDISVPRLPTIRRRLVLFSAAWIPGGTRIQSRTKREAPVQSRGNRKAAHSCLISRMRGTG